MLHMKILMITLKKCISPTKEFQLNIESDFSDQYNSEHITRAVTAESYIRYIINRLRNNIKYQRKTSKGGKKMNTASYSRQLKTPPSQMMPLN